MEQDGRQGGAQLLRLRGESADAWELKDRRDERLQRVDPRRLEHERGYCGRGVEESDAQRADEDEHPRQTPTAKSNQAERVDIRRHSR
ncbi:MAG: hypothetical protein ACXVRK_02455 [Gaiellaceae bacterium]